MVDCEIIWCIKDETIGNTFFDEAAAAFLMPSLEENFLNFRKDRKVDQTVFKRKKYEAKKEKLVAAGIYIVISCLILMKFEKRQSSTFIFSICSLTINILSK